MELPNDSIGPTDLIQYRDCPRRFSYGMRRHLGPGEQSDEQTPEAGSWAGDYGSAIHAVIHELEEGATRSTALARAWDQYGRRLLPEDIQALQDDAQTYLTRDFPNTRTVLSEDEIRVPLMLHRGKQIYFRTRIDRLYERLDEPGHFIHVDYKSERQPRSEKEVRDNLQLWMTNWAIHDYFPEIDELTQIYDQLKFGQQRTHKTADARQKIKSWIIHEATRVIEDEDRRSDGLLRPTKNDYCAWCPLIDSCSVVPELSEWARVRIAALAPTVKEGRKTVVQLDPAKLDEYVQRFEEAKQAVKILERFERAVRDLVRDLPAEKRAALGYDLRGRRERTYTPEALSAMHEALGSRFYELAKVTKKGLESQLADEPDLLAFALGLADEAIGSEALVAAR